MASGPSDDVRLVASERSEKDSRAATTCGPKAPARLRFAVGRILEDQVVALHGLGETLNRRGTVGDGLEAPVGAEDDRLVGLREARLGRPHVDGDVPLGGVEHPGELVGREYDVARLL